MKPTAYTRLLIIKIIHTVIWAFFVTCIFLVLWSGFTGKLSVWSWLAAGAVCVEGLIILVFKGMCPLTIMARRYSDSTKSNFDIFLPDWLAKNNQLIFTSLFAIGLIAMIIRYLG